MSLNNLLVDREEYRVVLVLPQSRMVLVEHHGYGHRLPRVSIPRWTRVAEQLAEALRERWAVRALVIDLLPKQNDLPPCAVVEVRASQSGFSVDGFISVHVDVLDEQELRGTERLTISDIIAGETKDRGPFSRVGWIEDSQKWIRESVVDHVVEFDDDVRKTNAGGYFALARFGTLRSPAYWLKGTGEPNAHEFSITRTLTRYCPECLPPLIATRADWNAWVTEEFGKPLHDVFSLKAFEQSAHCLAKLQLQSVAHIDELLTCGCFDQRLPILRARLPGLIRYLEDSMARQVSTKVPVLNAKRLLELGYLLEEASATMESLCIPDSVIHNDMNPNNILFDGVRAVFSDWSEGGVGCPFLTFQHLRVQAEDADQSHTWALRIKGIYKAHWRSVLDESLIERALAICPPLAIASYLIGRDSSFTSPLRNSDPVQGYARSLARHMDRFARSSEFLEAICH